MHMLDIFRFLRPSRRPPAASGLIAWDQSFSVDNGLIDGEHKAILGLLNLLYDDWISGSHAIDQHGLVDELGRMLATHFANEEAVLNAHRCPRLAEHSEEHRTLLSQFAALQDAQASGGTDEAALARFLKHVVVDHVLGHDLALKPYLHR